LCHQTTHLNDGDKAAAGRLVPACHAQAAHASFACPPTTIIQSKVIRLQLGQYVDMWGVYPNAVNISSTSSSYRPNDLNGFTAFNHTDLQNFTDLHAIAGQATCIAAGAAGAQYASLMTTCMAGPPATTQCCVDLATGSQAQVIAPSLLCLLTSASYILTSHMQSVSWMLWLVLCCTSTCVSTVQAESM